MQAPLDLSCMINELAETNKIETIAILYLEFEALTNEDLYALKQHKWKNLQKIIASSNSLTLLRPLQECNFFKLEELHLSNNQI